MFDAGNQENVCMILATITVILAGHYPQMITVKPQVAQAQNINEHWHCSFEIVWEISDCCCNVSVKLNLQNPLNRHTPGI